MKKLTIAQKRLQITTIVEVIQMANQGKCVVYRGGRIPAAFVQNFQARHLYNEIKAGVLFYYIPKTRPTNRAL